MFRRSSEQEETCRRIGPLRQGKWTSFHDRLSSSKSIEFSLTRQAHCPYPTGIITEASALEPDTNISTDNYNAITKPAPALLLFTQTIVRVESIEPIRKTSKSPTCAHGSPDSLNMQNPSRRDYYHSTKLTPSSSSRIYPRTLLPIFIVIPCAIRHRVHTYDSLHDQKDKKWITSAIPLAGWLVGRLA
ncbi:hypothetical protein KCU88_g3135, partial [Aureobasidium melanogenum]